jgi:hypothetical protein
MSNKIKYQFRLYDQFGQGDNVKLVEKVEEITKKEEEKPKPWVAHSFEIKDLDSVIKSLTSDEKYKLDSKKALKNFREWLDTISDKLMEEKRKKDDSLFDDN